MPLPTPRESERETKSRSEVLPVMKTSRSAGGPDKAPLPAIRASRTFRYPTRSGSLTNRSNVLVASIFPFWAITTPIPVWPFGPELPEKLRVPTALRGILRLASHLIVLLGLGPS
ncbi:hypothetical protein DTO164E3_7470 [Paecilomyces variotii]|nr:hypothetical protein DTO164E3_7470 [Paecilomyces variotii]KAJ9201509.1 hypothetical protein DTO032I3_4136 [Paecilomyces variotii]KAJ9275663.1 hypothetical protein DTO021D3_7483 [Paecilomyces variotii]KAJ9339945.1 hypothetical protein DTO027B6_7516 [Paecilomyces variotii]KAJ9377276.1 hypothetical protein DTO032I4_8193 [Paecilomyces variotii]